MPPKYGTLDVHAPVQYLTNGSQIRLLRQLAVDFGERSGLFSLRGTATTKTFKIAEFILE